MCLGYHPCSFLPECSTALRFAEARCVILSDAHSFGFNCCTEGRGEVAPVHLRIYANHPNIVDFSEAETTKAQLDITLLQGEPGVVEYPLRVAAFTSINSVSLFFVRLPPLSTFTLVRTILTLHCQSESVGGDVSRIYYIGFKGDIRELKKDKDPQMDIPAANAADAPLFDRLQDKATGQQTTAR